MGIFDRVKSRLFNNENIPLNVTRENFFSKKTLTVRDIPNLKQLFSEDFSWYRKRIVDVLEQINDVTFTKYCLENYVKDFNADELKRIIKHFNNPELSMYIMENYMNRFDMYQLEELLITLKDTQLIKYCVQNYQGSLNKLRLIKEIGDYEYIKECIRNAGMLGLSEKNVKKLVLATKDMKYIKQYFMFEGENKKIDLPEGMTIGIEIELNNIGNAELYDLLFDGWKAKSERSADCEVISPILSPDKKSTEDIYLICSILKQLDGKISTSCGGHIHIGKNYFSGKLSEHLFLLTYCNVEKILYKICNSEADPLRGVHYAQPISGFMEEEIRKDNKRMITLDLLKHLQSIQNDKKGHRFCSLNTLTVTKDENGNEGATIEFRMPNGTLDPKVWIENIELFGGMIRAGNELAKIYSKSKEERTPEDEEKIMAFSIICSRDASEEEKLAALLKLAIRENARECYEKRYRANSVLLENSSHNDEILKASAQGVFHTYRMGKNIYTGIKRVTTFEVLAAEQRLARDRSREMQRVV